MLDRLTVTCPVPYVSYLRPDACHLHVSLASLHACKLSHFRACIPDNLPTKLHLVLVHPAIFKHLVGAHASSTRADLLL